MPAPSYAHGASSVELLGETIGDNLRRTVERFGANEALVVRHQNFRASYGEFWELTGRAAWRGGVNGVMFLACVGVILAISSAFNGDAGVVGFGALIFLTVGAAVAFVIGLALGLLFAGVDLALVTATRAILDEKKSRP